MQQRHGPKINPVIYVFIVRVCDSGGMCEFVELTFDKYNVTMTQLTLKDTKSYEGRLLHGCLINQRNARYRFIYV